MGQIPILDKWNTPTVEWWIGAEITNQHKYDQLIASLDSIMMAIATTKEMRGNTITIRILLSASDMYDKCCVFCKNIMTKYVDTISWCHCKRSEKYQSTNHAQELVKTLQWTQLSEYIAWSNGFELYAPLYIEHFYDMHYVKPDLGGYFSQGLISPHAPPPVYNGFADTYEYLTARTCLSVDRPISGTAIIRTSSLRRLLLGKSRLSTFIDLKDIHGIIPILTSEEECKISEYSDCITFTHDA